MKNEKWKDVVGYEGHYEISDLGRVKSTKNNKELIMRTILQKSGYVQIKLCNGKHESFTVHRLVADAFCLRKNKNKNEVNHKNGVKSDNAASNLEWCSRSDNQRHAYGSGLIVPRRGEGTHSSKLRAKDVISIREILQAGKVTQREIAEMFGVAAPTISLIKHGKAWSHI